MAVSRLQQGDVGKTFLDRMCCTQWYRQLTCVVPGNGRLDKDEARTAIMEMPEMLYKLCLVARELELSYAAYSIGVRIGNPCPAWLLHDALFLEGSSDAVHTPRRKF